MSASDFLIEIHSRLGKTMLGWENPGSGKKANISWSAAWIFVREAGDHHAKPPF